MSITLKQIDEKRALVRSMGRELNGLIHEIAMMIFYHAAPKEISDDCQGSGDCTRAVKLVRDMPASMRRTTLIAWFTEYTPIRIKLSDNGDKCEFDPKYKKLSKEDKLGWWKLEEAAETPFYDIAERVPEEKSYDFAALLKMVERLGSQIQKKVDEGKVKPEDVPSALALVTAVSGLKVERVKPTADNENSSGSIDANDTPAPNADDVIEQAA